MKAIVFKYLRLITLTNFIVLMIKGYQICISPLLPKACRFYPSCSQYALEAFNKYGFVKGVTLTTKRLLRCNPFGRSGIDPLP